MAVSERQTGSGAEVPGAVPAGRARDGSAEGVVGEPGELEGGSGEVIRAGSGTADGNASSVQGI